MTRNRAVIVLALVALIGVGVAASAPLRASGELPTMMLAADGTLPSYVHDAGPMAEMAYQAAIDRPEVLSAVPCLCGCIETLGHQSNLDCYLEDQSDSGLTIYSTHGLYCGVCQLITRDALAGADAGMSPSELHAMIVDTYGS